MKVDRLSTAADAKRICGMLAFIFFISFCFDINAQTRTRARLTGFIIDVYGSSMRDVVVTARDANGKAYSAKSDWRGDYTIELPEESYSISFKRSMYTTLEIKNYQIPHAGTLHLDVGLSCPDCQEVNTSARLRKKKGRRLRASGAVGYSRRRLTTHSTRAALGWLASRTWTLDTILPAALIGAFGIFR